MKKRKKWSEMTREEKDQVKAIWKKRILVGMAIVAVVASIAATFFGCAHKTPNINNDPSVPIVNPDPGPGGGGTNPIVNPDDPTVNPDDPIVNPDDPTVNPDDPSVNPDDPGTNPDDPSVNPDDPGTNPDDPSVNPDDPTVNPDDPSVNPDDPGTNPDDPTVNPDDPGTNPETPIVTNLDFSGLETKLEEIAAQVQRGATLNKLMSYSVSEGKLYFAADITRAGNQRIIIYSADGDYNVESQENIDSIANSITKSDFAEVVTLQKASADIELNGVTYSKDGFAGDNVFARQCGIENPLMTYVSDIGTVHLNPQSSTNYSSGYDVLVVYVNEGNLYVKLQGVTVECDGEATQNEILTAALGGNAYVGGALTAATPINLGKNLMPDEATSSATTEYLATLTNAMVQSGEWYM